MGKKKADSIEQSITKEYGENILIGGHDLIQRKPTIISLSPKLDLILGGGIPEGSMMIFTGQAKVGKSLSALDFASTCQKSEFGGEFCPEGRDVYYYNIEGRLKKRDLCGITNLNLNKFYIIESVPGKILHAEEYLQIGQTLINSKLGSIHIFDSFSALCTEAELTTSMNQMQRADGAKLLAKFCRKISNVIPVNKNIVIGITHLMGNVTGYGQAYQEKSGQAIKYQVDIKLQAKAVRSWKDKNECQIGQETDWQCITSAIGPPGKTTTSYIRYGQGIDKTQELISLACDLGIIQKGGAWYTLSFVEGDDPPKVQGIEKVYEIISKNTEWIDQLNTQIKTLL